MKSFKDSLIHLWTNHPLKSILIIALSVRLIAVIFSQGFGFHDDHFLIIESAEAWSKGYDWNNWMPFDQIKIQPDKEPVPQGHSFLYPGLHFVLFEGLHALGINNAKVIMFIVRLLHALLSLLVVFWGYKIVSHYTNDKLAKTAGLLLALLWFMPMLSVRNLVEVVVSPFLLWGTWILIKQEKGGKIQNYFWAGAILGIAFSIRFQTLIIPASLGLILLIRKQWKEALTVGLGSIASIALVQGVIDYFIWGKPFVEMIQYIKYNINERYAYGTNNPYMYLTLLTGMIIPPLGLFLFFGWLTTWRKYALLFWPSFLFFAFHTYFINKQERFILPIIPLFIIAGVIGWWTFMDKSAFWNKHQKIFKGSLVFFWIINFLLLPIISTTYSKRSRCESMYFLSKEPDAKVILLEETIRGDNTMFPTFYSQKDLRFYDFSALEPGDCCDSMVRRGPMYSIVPRKIPWHIEPIASPECIVEHQWPQPDHILFVSDKKLNERVIAMKEFYPNMSFQAEIKPSYIDIFMKKMTPSNNNQSVYIYKTN